MESKRLIVVKVGTNTLTDSAGVLDRGYIRSFVEQVCEIKARGYAPIIVTSAAIAAGLEELGLKSRPSDIPTLQAAASVGQVALVEAYSAELKKHGVVAGQVLLTRNDTADRNAYLHARDTLTRLVELGAVPVVNENDTVAVEEIRFGDNDTLAALVATMVGAEKVILLTDVEGLYTSDPRKNSGAEHIDVVEHIDRALLGMASGVGTSFGSGGMVTKLRAARVLMSSGIPMVLCDGRKENALLEAFDGTSNGTYFNPQKEASLTTRKRWIAIGGAIQGTIIVDDGAVCALQKGGTSLLCPGVTAVLGDFEAGSPVAVQAAEGIIIARGLSGYSSQELRLVAGKQMAQAAKIVPNRNGAEVIHCDQMVLF